MTVQVWVRLRRPDLARLVFAADNPEVSRVRVCDGRFVWERPASTILRLARTLRVPFARGGILQNIPHPLDETAYCAEQFFSPTPFLPPVVWGGGRDKLKISATRRTYTRADGQKRECFEVVFESNPACDTLLLDARSFAPIRITRVGEHAGQVQELLRETFLTVRLGPNLPPDLFRWTNEDERGITLQAMPTEPVGSIGRPA